MRKMILTGLLGLLLMPVGSAWAVPMCDGPNFDLDRNGRAENSEIDEAALGEQRLRAHGINANLTRFWNGCLQTFVRENGHETIRYFDPDSLREIPVN